MIYRDNRVYIRVIGCTGMSVCGCGVEKGVRPGIHSYKCGIIKVLKVVSSASRIFFT